MVGDGGLPLLPGLTDCDNARRVAWAIGARDRVVSCVCGGWGASVTTDCDGWRWVLEGWRGRAVVYLWPAGPGPGPAGVPLAQEDVSAPSLASTRVAPAASKN